MILKIVQNSGRKISQFGFKNFNTLAFSKFNKLAFVLLCLTFFCFLNVHFVLADCTGTVSENEIIDHGWFDSSWHIISDGIDGPYVVDDGDGIVTDHGTGLMWQQSDDGDSRHWNDACEYCNNLNLAGYNDWELPDIYQLLSLYDSDYDNGININYFSDNPRDWYWSGSTDANRTGSAWDVDFLHGNMHTSGKSGGGYVRCVRSIPSGSLDVYTTGGTTLDPSTNILHIPCVEVGTDYFWVDLQISTIDPLTIKFIDLGETTGNSEDCDIFDINTWTLQVSSFLLSGRSYKLSLQWNSSGFFELSDIGDTGSYGGDGTCYVACKYGNPLDCAVSCDSFNSTSSGVSALQNVGYTSVRLGPKSWDACTNLMRDLDQPGW